MLQILNTALVALRRNVTRSMLTMLGIVIGIAAVITMMEIGNGAAEQISSKIANMGSNVIMVRSVALQRAGVSAGASLPQAARRHTSAAASKAARIILLFLIADPLLSRSNSLKQQLSDHFPDW